MLNEIKLKQESKHAKKRVGRGMASGTGKTCGRGHKGQKSLQEAKYKLDLKVVKCHSKEDCLKLDLPLRKI